MSDIQKLYIDLDLKENLLVTVNCKQLDNLNLILNIWDNGIQADLNNYRCRLKALKQDQVPLIQNTDITINNNEVNIASDEQLTTTSGIVKTELQFMDKTTGEKKSTFNLNIKVIPSILEVDRTISVATITLLQELDNKLDEIEDIGDVLDEAKTVKTGLESDITNVKNIKENLDSTINTANATKTFLDTSNTNSNNAKIALDASNASANNIKASLETTITNAENKRLDIVTECALADQKISAMQEFGDITVITQDVSNLKTEIQNARNGEVNLDERLDKVDAQLSDLTNNKANKTDLINGSLRIAQRYNASDSTTFTNPINKYIMDMFRCNGTGTVVPVSGGGCAVTGTINFKYVMEKVDFTLLPSTFTLSYGLNGINNEITVTKANCTVDSNGNGIIFDLNVTNATLNYVHYGKAPFIPRLYAEELSLCQRYCLNANIGIGIYNNFGFNGVVAGATSIIASIDLPTPMRIIPTLNLVASNFQVNIFKTDVHFSPTAISILNKTNSNIIFNLTGSSLPLGENVDIRLNSDVSMILDAGIY